MLKTVGNALKPVAREAILNAGSALGGLAGSRLGSSAGGARVGRTLAAKISKMFGCGDYVVNEKPVANSLISGNANAYASFGNNGQSVRIQHREYLFDLTQGAVAGAFTNVTMPVNPGLFASFPYLAPIAANFEEYRINGLVFEYVSTTSPYLAGGAMGSVVLAMQYNPLASAFSSKVQMENSDFAISARPDQSMVYGVECASNMQNMYLVRQGGTTAPLTSTDMGIMQFAIQSPIAAGVVLGEVWVSYDIELMRPKAQVAGQGWLHFGGTGGAVGTYPSFTTTMAAYGTLSGVSYTNGVSGSASVVLPTFPANTCISVTMTVKYAGATAAGTALSILCSNSVGASIYGNGTTLDSSGLNQSLSVGTSILSQVFLASGTPTLTLSWPASPAGTTSATIDLTVSVVGPLQRG